MGLGLSLDLFDLDEPLVAVAGRGPGRVDGPVVGVDVDGIHPPVAHVRVVRDGQQLVARLALRVHPVPQVLGVCGIERAVGHLRHLGAIAEEDVAVQVAIARHRGPLVRAERGELARVVVVVGDLDVVFPDRSRHLRAHERLDGRSRREGEQIKEDLLLVLRVVGVFQNQRLRFRQLAERRPWRVRFFRHARRTPSGRSLP